MARSFRAASAGLGAAIAVGATAGPVAAHPHVWIDSRSQILFDDEGLVNAIRQRWTFDEMYSAFAVQGLDADGDGRFSREELQPVAEANIQELGNFGYFTFLGETDPTAGGPGFDAPRDYWLEHEDGRLTMEFTLPLATPSDPRDGGTAVRVFDPGYFIGFTLPEDDPVTLAGSPAECSTEVARAGEFDSQVAAFLSALPSTVRDLPPEVMGATSTNPNTIRVICR